MHKRICWHAPDEIQVDIKAWLERARTPVSVAIVLALGLLQNPRAVSEQIVVFSLEHSVEPTSRRRRLRVSSIHAESMEKIDYFVQRGHYRVGDLTFTPDHWLRLTHTLQQDSAASPTVGWALVALSIRSTESSGRDASLLYTLPVSGHMVAMCKGVGANWQDIVSLWIANCVE